MYKYSKYNKDYKKFDVLFSGGGKRPISSIIPIWLIVSVLIILLVMLSFYLYDLWFDKNSTLGSYSGKSEEQILADLNAQVNEGEMNVSIANTIKFPNGSLNDGIAHIENIAANHVDQKVQIYLEGSNDVLYESGAISPNHCINTIKLKKDLDPGTYKAIAVFIGYDVNDRSEKGSISAQINIQVF